MSLAWEVSDADIKLALGSLGLQISKEHVNEARDEINQAAIERAALSSTDFDKQCAYAHEELKRQLSEAFLDKEELRRLECELQEHPLEESPFGMFSATVLAEYSFGGEKQLGLAYYLNNAELWQVKHSSINEISKWWYLPTEGGFAPSVAPAITSRPEYDKVPVDSRPSERVLVQLADGEYSFGDYYVAADMWRVPNYSHPKVVRWWSLNEITTEQAYSESLIPVSL